MTLKFFSIFMGGALTIAIILLTVAKNLVSSFTAFGKKPVVLAIITAVIDALIAFAITYMTDDTFTLFWILCFVFLLFGCIQMSVMHSKFVSRNAENKYKALGAEIVFSFGVLLLILVLFSALQYFVKDKGFMFYPVLISFLMFIVPLFVYHTFLAAYNIPASVFNTWEYPLAHPIDPPEDSANERLLVIGFEIPKKITDVKKTFFRAKTPENIVLGELFYHFVNDYNELQSETPVQYLNEQNEPVTWWFRLKRKWYQFNKVLDPNLTVRENGIKENSVIICEHIRKPD